MNEATVIRPITISGFTFLALKRWENQGRNHITFSSTTPDGVVTELSAYESSSELGFWRLFVFLSHDSDTYYKGLVDKKTGFMGWDYVQQTFIHLELQKYFDEVYAKLPPSENRFEYREFREEMIFDEDPRTRITEMFEKSPSLYKSIYGNTPFEEVIQKEQTKNEEYIEKNKKIESIKNEIDDTSRIEKIEPFYSYSEIFTNRCGVSIDTRDENLKALSKQIQETFPTLGEPELVYDNFTFQDSMRVSYWSRAADTTSLKGKIYKIMLRSVDGNVIYLYFMIYSLKTIPYSTASISPLIVANKCTPIFMTTTDEITQFGLYAKYVVAGNYICKILDYTRQCLKTNRKCTMSYSYIGHIYDTLYPYQERKIHLLKIPTSYKLPSGIITRQKAGRRKSRKTRKNKSGVFNDAKHLPAFKAGYGSAKKARNTLKRLRRATTKKARQVASTMYYRAKYHKYQTPNMKAAMKIYGDYLKPSK
jgi:hypothetical protein